ncbi:MAG: MFS transporter [Alphaproteobacteria bacterium]|jgi:MFS family permease|nr:MFS transporter [Alphaproteobacteria bacterium]
MFWLFLIVFIDSIGFGIILPLLPIFALKFQITAFHLGILTAIFAFFQLITSPVLGALSDRFGRKYIMLVCLLAIGFSYHLLANATTFTEALISRALAGIFTGNISVALAATSDLSSTKNRAKYMGIIGAATGLGFVMGPTVGGFLAGNDVETANLHLVFNMAAIATISAGVLVAIFFKETLPKNYRGHFNLKTKVKRTLFLIYNNRNMMFLIYLSVLMWFSFSSINVFLTTWSVERFNLSPFHLGIIGTVFALVAAVVQIVSPRYIQGGKAILIGFQISAFAIFAVLFHPSLPVLGVILVFIATGIGILYPNLNSTISMYGSNSQRGFILGLSQSAGTLGQTIGPLIVGFSYSAFNPSVAWVIIGGGFILASFITLSYMLHENKNL